MIFLILQEIKVLLLSLFSIKDLKKVSLILGIKIYRDRFKRLLGLSQSNIHRGDIGYGILTRIVSGYLQDSSENHWKVILKYLRNTKNR